MKWPWVSAARLETAKVTLQASVAIAESQQHMLGVQKREVAELQGNVGALRSEVQSLQCALGKASAESARWEEQCADWKKQFDDVDKRCRAMIEADPVKVYAQDGPDDQATVTVTCKVDRNRLLRRPDKVFDAFGRRVGNELTAKFKTLLDEIREAHNKAEAAATYRDQ
jgi:hypothetical protein